MMQIGMRLGFPWINQNTKCPSKFFNFADGTNVLSPSINFSRTTNATVTNSAGLITYAPHNLLTYSEQFDNAAWTKDGVTITANTIAAPNGTTTADTVTGTTGNFRFYQLATILNGSAYTMSVYAKQGTSPTVGFSFINIALSTPVFTFATETWSTPANWTTSYQKLDNGWYRLIATYTSNFTYGGPSIIVSGATTAYIWGLQFEIGSTATTYNSTTVKNLLGYSELFDNAAWTKSNSFVQTNLLTYSEAFDNAAWGKFNGFAVTPNTHIAPNGYQTADTITFTSGTSVTRITTATLTAGTTYTFSIWAQSLTGNTSLFVDLGDGVAVSKTVSSSFERITFTLVAGSAGSFVDIICGGAATMVWWGAQLVQGSVAGDYRRTDAAALPVYYPNHNGVVCAEKLVESATTSSHAWQLSSGSLTTNTLYTASIYAKAAERRYLTICESAASASRVCFDLQTGTVAASAGGGTSSITSVGNGWYRLSLTRALVSGTSTVSGSWDLYLDNSPTGTTTYTGDGTSGVYIFGAQLSDSASLDPYLLNAAAAPSAQAYYGARFDYDPVTLQAKGLLIEEQRVNNLLNSQSLTSASWLPVNNTVATSSVIGIDGISTFNLITSAAVSGNRVQQSITVANATTYTLSAYFKIGSSNFAGLVAEGNASAGAIFNLTGNGAVVSTAGSGVSATITNINNGIYRCTMTFTTTGVAINIGVGISNGSTYAFGIYPSGLNSTIYSGFTQLEAGAFATSYIPTAASQVTRAADVATIQGSNFYSWYNQNEGSVFANADSYRTSYSGAIVLWNGSSISNRLDLSLPSGAANVARFTVAYSGTIQVDMQLGGTPQANTFIKAAAAYKSNDFAATYNNTTVSVDSSGEVPLVSQLTIGSRESVNSFQNGTIKQISYFPQRLSNETLKGLTA